MSRKLIACKTCENAIAKSASHCPYCGAKQKSIFKGWWWKLPIFVPAFSFLIIYAWSVYKVYTSESTMDCASNRATSGLARLFSENLNNPVHEMHDIEEISMDNHLHIRRCRAFIISSNFEQHIYYRITKDINDEYSISIERSSLQNW